jgi:hypothetical protein
MSKPPFRVTLLLALVLSITIWNFLRLWTALAWRATLIKYAGAQITTVTAVSGGIWFLAGLALAWSVLRRSPWSAKMLVGAAAAYSIWYWCERLIWQNPRQNLLFAVIVNLVLFIFTLFATKSLSREAYERKIENPKIE